MDETLRERVNPSGREYYPHNKNIYIIIIR